VGKLTVPQSTGTEDAGLVKFTVDKDFGKWKTFFVDTGLATPDYKVHVEIDKSKLEGKVKSVTWDLPKGYFGQDEVTTTDKSKNFEMKIEAWKPFEVGVEIELESGKKLRSRKIIFFDDLKK
jgi:hypothetical protein